MHPPNLLSPPAMVRIAKAVYSHWRERKIEREGQRIIPALNVRSVMPFSLLLLSNILYSSTMNLI